MLNGFFRGVGMWFLSTILIVASISLIEYDFETALEPLLDMPFLAIGAIGCFIFFKWIKE